MTNGFTPTQERLLDVLADGQSHQKNDLMAAIGTEATSSLLRVHLTFLRRKLRPMGQDVVCELLQERTYYRQVRKISPSE